MKNSKIIRGALAAALALGPTVSVFADATLNGAGATFPYPIYSKWFDAYNKLHPDVKINYQSIGSGGGIKQFTAKTVDFGASDGPMSDQQVFAVDGKSLHIPTVLGAVAIAYNVEGVQDLKFSGDVIANIFLGKITSWQDPAIVALNPDSKLPDGQITVVHRSDGSGTTYCFVDYLSKVSADWKKQVGKGTSVNWPVGLGGKGNEGVAGTIKQIKNSIGYVELIYAKQNGIQFGSVKNQAGKFIVPSVETVNAAAAGAAAKIPKDFRVSIVDAPGNNAYPISTFTWLLIYQKNPGQKGKILKDFLQWMLTDGQKMCEPLGYAPLPDAVNKMVQQEITTIQ